ncbi:hypothetical protein H6CHR_04332 [Variovorax sp. PBL-H6]|uniref:DUF4259 domain-containing protein n=1 Tax=Variovorax sp. PBL-H6 TaxID=434009 RepID=UPI0013164080|nr:DUF4259 domain-containing protein [Variovorax sp. PBL-H6]VTU34992.1 hypothetical protein H6CHR_04332 [Variovorax sp. PBL-H6]
MNVSRRACVAVLAWMLTLPVRAGAWGEGAFDNDAAQDFLAECARSTDATVVAQAIDMALTASFVDADDGAAAVAAAELIASALGSNGAAPKTRVAPCLSATPPEQLRALAPRAAQAMVRVTEPASSELAQQWAEEKPNRWTASVQRLAARLRNSLLCAKQRAPADSR